MTFNACLSRPAAADPTSRNSIGFARRLAQLLQKMWPGVSRIAVSAGIALTAVVQAGAITPTADDGYAPGANAQVVASAIQPDGKIIVGGYFTELQEPGQNDPVARGRIARINADGTIDQSFNPGANGPVEVIRLQADGRILIGGYFTSVGGVARNRVARLNADGSLDVSFDPNLGGSAPSLVHVTAIAVDSSNRVLVGGEFTTAAPSGGASVARMRMVRLEASGALDASFNPSFNNVVRAIAIDRSGRIIVGGGFTTVASSGSSTAIARHRIVRLSAAGIVDPGYDPKANNLVTALAFQADGKLIAVGHFTSLQPNGAGSASLRSRMARLLENGTLDTDFRAGVNADAYSVAVAPDGRIVVSGVFRAAFSTGDTAGTRADYIARFAADGTLDNSFFPGPSYAVLTFAIQADGKLFLGGYFKDFFPGAFGSGIVRRYMARLNEDGSLDSSLSPSADRGILALAQDAGGQILVGGSFTSLGGITRRSMARMSPAGVVDPSFDPATNGQVSAIAVQPDGRIIIGGLFSSVTANGSATPVTRNFLARINADGTVDTAFNPNPNGGISAIVVQPDGKILIGGSFSSLTPAGATEAVTKSGITRLNADGTIDTAFNTIANNAVSAIALESDGKILIGGAFNGITNGNTTYGVNGLARLNSDGTVVTSFAPNANAPVTSLRVLSNGKILVGGSFTSLFPLGDATATTRNGLALLTTEGKVDAEFDPKPNGFTTVTMPLSDGKILIGGTFSEFMPGGGTDVIKRNFFARINENGTIDSAFDPGPDGQVLTILALSDGSAIIGGQFTSFRPSGATATRLNRGLAKVTATGAIDISFKPSVGVGAGEVRTVAYQRDGTMILGGVFNSLAGATTPNMIRMRSEGIVDTSFQAKPNGSVETIAAREIVVDDTTLNQRLAWLESTGRLRTGLNVHPNLLIDGTVDALAVQSNGQILAGGSFSLSGPGDVTWANLVRFNPDGSIDESFKPNPVGPVYSIAVQGNGMIVIGGAFTSVGGATRNRLARLNPNGTIDLGFNPNSSGQVYAIAIQSDGKVIVGGDFNSFSPNGATTAVTMNRIARLNSDGTVDTPFNPNPNADVSCIAIQTDGKILIGGLFTTLQPAGASTTTNRSALARLNTDGTIDTGFDPAPNNQPLFLRQLAGGKILAAGFFTGFNPNGATTLTERTRVAILNTDGTVDTAFNANVDGAIFEVGVQSNGSLILGGSFTSVGGVVRNRIARVSATGALDTTFNPNAGSFVSSVLVLPDDSILVGGGFAGLRIGGVLLAGGEFTEIGGAAVPHFALLSTDGTPVVGAVPSVDAAVRAMLRLPDGRTVFAGSFENVGGQARGRVARLLADDTLDPSFNPGADGAVHALAMQDDGKLLLGGTFANVGGSPRAGIARVNVDGTLDAGFNASANGEVTAITVQADGRILVGGTFTTLSGSSRNGFGRLNTDGSIDTAFDPGVNGPVRTIALQADRSILIGGTFTSVANTARAGAARILDTGALDSAYDPQADGAINTFVLAPDGKLIAGGAFRRIGGEPRYLIARLSPATQAAIGLSVGSDNASLNWMRTGSIPEVGAVTFQFSTDGSNWSTPVAGSRDAGVPGWRASVPGLPANTLFFARARATVAGNRGASPSFVETVRVAFFSSTSGGSDGSEEPPEMPSRPGNFLAETYLSANPALANSLFGLPDRLDLAWVHYWTYGRNSDTEGIFLPPGGESSVDPKLINLSARSWIGPGEQSLVMGVYVADAPARLFVRARGPSLAAFNIPNPVADPAITIYSGQTPIAANDDWATDPSVTPQALSEAGVTMDSALDSAMVVTLQPGSYTFVISGKGGTGVGLGELFLLQGQAGRLTNLSARASVGEGGDILIAGFSRVGIGEILVRGLGPELANYDIVNFLADPYITLHKQSTGTTILANNDWGQVIGAISDKNARAGALPLPSGSKDAAAYMVLGSGGYTIHVGGAQAGQTGVALIELFELR